MPETIVIKFDPKSLPRWAQNDKNVVRCCESNLAFRCDVFNAQTAGEKKQLKRRANHWAENVNECGNCLGTGTDGQGDPCRQCAGTGFAAPV